MATDIGTIVENLVSFYDFGGKDVIHVGAGGGQMIAYARYPRRVVAIDNDAGAVERLRAKIAEQALAEKVAIIDGDFFEYRGRADVVFLEFCLHEMADPAKAIDHAAALAPRTLVIDHMPESKWAWYACESEKLAARWSAIERRAVLRRSAFEARHYFKNYDELKSKLEGLGGESARRIRALESQRDIEIAMPYGIVLL